MSAQDVSSTVVTTYATAITVAIGTNPGSGTLSGTLTQTPVSGMATFTGLSINNAGVGYTLQATSGSLSPATTSGFMLGTDFFDRFAGTGTLTGHTTDSGDTWGPTGYIGTSIGSGFAYANTSWNSPNHWYEGNIPYSSWTPPSADYAGKP